MAAFTGDALWDRRCLDRQAPDMRRALSVSQLTRHHCQMGVRFALVVRCRRR